ncbi:hypothetical protein G6F24_016813 [Rhizopus arrhizus]|nr:hypothetical protein G6F24_016813 [Rhizopus arrhizus]
MAWMVTSPPTLLTVPVVGSAVCCRPVSRRAPVPMCTVDSLSTTATPTPITAGTAPSWPGSRVTEISFVTSDLMVMALEAITVPCTSMCE